MTSQGTLCILLCCSSQFPVPQPPAESHQHHKQFTNATLNDNYVYTMYLEPPSKAAVLAYLDKKGPKPRREARVVVVQGRTVPNKVVEVVVGPLPSPTTWRQVNISKAMPTVPFNQRPYTAPDERGCAVSHPAAATTGVLLYWLC